MTIKLRGVFTALVTPLIMNKLISNVFELCAKDNLLPALDLSLWYHWAPTLTPEEWEQLISIAVEEAAGTAPVIAGCGTNATHSTIQNIRRAKALADAGLAFFHTITNQIQPD